ncbi:PWWP domain-containing protein 3 [Linum perenne]
MNVTQETVVGSSSLTGKESKDPGGEGFRDDSTTNNRVENGIWLRPCDKAGFVNDLGGGDSAMSKNLNSVKFGPMVDGNGESLEDSEMNGVSSLLEMQQSGRYPGLDSVLNVIDKNENNGYGNDKHGGLPRGGEGCPDEKTEGGSEVKKDMEREGNSEDELYDNEFDVGDFVWGKIKSHPWWPGRVYDPLDASEYAKKVKHGGDKILVAYFGDETFAWCNPSQLKPFHENFVEMSNQSTSKNFVNAVEKALEEVGRSVDLRLTCSCVPRDNLFGFGRYLAVNAGVKDGLLVPEDGVEKFMNDLFDPHNVFTSVKGLAQVGRIDNVFDHAVLKSSLSAFYRAKGGTQLPVYQESQPIPGLEDETHKNNLVEGGTFPGPVEEDWISSSPRGSEFSRDSQNSLQKSQLHRRRKRKSIAKIISGSPNAEDEPVMKDDATKTVSGKKKRRSQGDLTGEEAIGVIGKPAPSGIRKRKGRDKAIEEVGSSHKVTDAAEVEASSGRPSASSVITKSKASNDIASSGVKKKSKGGNEVSSSGIRENGGKEADTKGSRTRGGAQVSSGSKRSSGGDESTTKGVGESVSRRRKRKKDGEVSECPPVAADNIISNPEADVSGLKKRNITSPLTWKSWKQEDIAVKKDENLGKTEVTASMVSVENKMDTNDSPTLSRERKKSWYLSPPFTNLTKGQKTKMVETEGLGEAAGHEMHNDLSNQTPKDHIIATEEAKARAAASEVLCQIRSAACDPLHVGESKNLDEVMGFVSELRSSGYADGSNLESNVKQRRGRKKRNLEESESTPVSDLKSQKNEEAKKSNKAGIKQGGNVLEGKVNEKQSESRRAVVAATLLVTFGPGSFLPTKNDLLRIYEPCGALNEETDMLYNNRCARVAFSTRVEAEEALKHSQQSNPFGATHVNFRLRFPSSTGSKSVKKTAAAAAAAASDSSRTNRSELHDMVQKLEMVSTMLKSSEESMSVGNLKLRVEGEIRGVIEKLNTMVRSGD